MLAYIAEVEPVGAVVRRQRQRGLEPLFGDRPVLALGGNRRQVCLLYTSYIHRLRKKLEPGGARITTVRGLGYCLEKPGGPADAADAKP